MTTAAERRYLSHAAHRAAIHVDPPPPPGERAEDEVTGAALVAVMDTYFAAMEDDLKLASAPATLKFGQVKDIRVNRVSCWVLVTVKFRAKKSEPNEVTFRVRRSWAGVLKDRLNRVLGE